MTIEERRAASRKRTENRQSAESFLKEGIRLQQGDRDFARLNFRLAEQCFVEAGDFWNAHVARRWVSLVEL
ncbi:MAG TPA: hypothetical protein VEX35_10325 [Allosphingosinicella sp.]|nr:hypothetical protein [Allosphingosinicella sp.]